MVFFLFLSYLLRFLPNTMVPLFKSALIFTTAYIGFAIVDKNFNEQSFMLLFQHFVSFNILNQILEKIKEMKLNSLKNISKNYFIIILSLLAISFCSILKFINLNEYNYNSFVVIPALFTALLLFLMNNIQKLFIIQFFSLNLLSVISIITLLFLVLNKKCKDTEIVKSLDQNEPIVRWKGIF